MHAYRQTDHHACMPCHHLRTLAARSSQNERKKSEILGSWANHTYIQTLRDIFAVFSAKVVAVAGRKLGDLISRPGGLPRSRLCMSICCTWTCFDSHSVGFGNAGDFGQTDKLARSESNCRIVSSLLTLDLSLPFVHWLLTASWHCDTTQPTHTNHLPQITQRMFNFRKRVPELSFVFPIT